MMTMTKMHLLIHPLYPFPSHSFPQPTPPGQKRQKEDWENIWYFGMFGGLALGAVLYIYKPKEE